MNRELIFAAITKSWNAETSASKEWSEENRALGQCAVTACIVQDYFGGDILNTVATLPDGSTDSHYYNVIHGQEVDFTRSQFPEGTTFTQGAPKTKGKTQDYASTREHILSYEQPKERYELLRTRVFAHLQPLEDY